MSKMRLFLGVFLMLAAIALVAVGLLQRGSAESPHRGARASAQTGPGLVLEPAEVDVGDVGQDQVIPFSFTITNTTASRLKLAQISKTCSCTEAVAEQKSLEPGESTKVTASWKTRASRGPSAVVVTVLFETDSSELLSGQMRLRGHVKADLELRPTNIEFGSGDEPDVVRVEILPGAGGTLPEPFQAKSSIPSAVSVSIDGRVLIARRLNRTESLEGHYILLETAREPASWPRIPLVSRNP